MLNDTKNQDIMTGHIQYLSRRKLIQLSLCLGVSSIFSGCGGGGSSSSEEIISPFLAQRAEPAGSLKDQVDQYSGAMDILSSIYLAPSNDAIESARGIFDVTRSRAMDSRPAEDFYRAAAYGSIVSSLAVERINNAVVALDSALYLGDRASATNSLSGNANLSNPQWGAEMLRRLLNIQSALNDQARFYQQAGVLEIATAVSGADSYAKKAVAYAVLRDSYHHWLDRMSGKLAITIPDNLRLNVAPEMSGEVMDAEVNRLPTLLSQVPQGIAYNTVTRRKDTNGDSPFEDFVGSTFMDALIEKFFQKELAPGAGILGFKGWVDKLDFQKQLKSETLNTLILQEVTGTGRTLLSIGKGFGIDFLKAGATGLILDGIGYAIERTAGKPAGCAYKLTENSIKVGFGFATFMGGVSATFATGGLGLIAGIAATASFLSSVNDLKNAINECKDLGGSPDPEKVNQLEEDAQMPPTRNVPALTNPRSAECDQLSRAGVIKRTVPQAKHSFSPEEARGILCGLATATRATSTPRTFTNLESSGRSLLQDYVQRHSTLTNPALENGNLSFFASDFAMLIRREPGSSQVEVPAITQAQLLCSGSGFIPMRSESPKNIQDILSLPELQPLSELGTGVKFNVQ